LCEADIAVIHRRFGGKIPRRGEFWSSRKRTPRGPEH
jgi:hypothetical protein